MRCTVACARASACVRVLLRVRVCAEDADDEEAAARSRMGVAATSMLISCRYSERIAGIAAYWGDDEEEEEGDKDEEDEEEDAEDADDGAVHATYSLKIV